MRFLLLGLVILLLGGCAGVALQSDKCLSIFICPEGPKIVPSSAHQLLNLPPPNTKAVVTAYKFPDLTGQRKSLDNVASFSNAVTQGGLSILIEALRDAGRGSWFVVVERAGLDNLSKERQLIVNTRKTYGGEEGNTLKPLLYAGLILEGGIVAYDSNIRTGGSGARYFGIGVNNLYREDIVTVTLRAVLVQTGEVLLNVTTTKTILSTGLGSDLFRFFDLGTELVEIESGKTQNEPVGYAVRAAIEAAVYGLVMEGMEAQIWDFDYPASGLVENRNETDKGTQ
jgi:curli production assembly/transport component CsgG